MGRLSHLPWSTSVANGISNTEQGNECSATLTSLIGTLDTIFSHGRCHSVQPLDRGIHGGIPCKLVFGQESFETLKLPINALSTLLTRGDVSELEVKDIIQLNSMAMH